MDEKKLQKKVPEEVKGGNIQPGNPRKIADPVGVVKKPLESDKHADKRLNKLFKKTNAAALGVWDKSKKNQPLAKPDKVKLNPTLDKTKEINQKLAQKPLGKPDKDFNPTRQEMIGQGYEPSETEQRKQASKLFGMDLNKPAKKKYNVTLDGDHLGEIEADSPEEADKLANQKWPGHPDDDLLSVEEAQEQKDDYGASWKQGQPLTPKQLEVFNYIKDFYNNSGHGLNSGSYIYEPLKKKFPGITDGDIKNMLDAHNLDRLTGEDTLSPDENEEDFMESWGNVLKEEAKKQDEALAKYLEEHPKEQQQWPDDDFWEQDDAKKAEIMKSRGYSQKQINAALSDAVSLYNPFLRTRDEKGEESPWPKPPQQPEYDEDKLSSEMLQTLHNPFTYPDEYSGEGYFDTDKVRKAVQNTNSIDDLLYAKEFMEDNGLSRIEADNTEYSEGGWSKGTNVPYVTDVQNLYDEIVDKIDELRKQPQSAQQPQQEYRADPKHLRRIFKSMGYKDDEIDMILKSLPDTLVK